MANLQTHYNFKLDLQKKCGKHTGGKWLIHGPKVKCNLHFCVICGRKGNEYNI